MADVKLPWLRPVPIMPAPPAIPPDYTQPIVDLVRLGAVLKVVAVVVVAAVVMRPFGER